MPGSHCKGEQKNDADIEKDYSGSGNLADLWFARCIDAVETHNT